MCVCGWCVIWCEVVVCFVCCDVVEGIVWCHVVCKSVWECECNTSVLKCVIRVLQGSTVWQCVGSCENLMSVW